LKRENETLKREIAELRETNNQLKQSRDEATRRTRPQPAPRGLKPSNTRSQASSEIADSSTDSELKHENETLKREIAELYERQTVNWKSLLTKQYEVLNHNQPGEVRNHQALDLRQV